MGLADSNPRKRSCAECGAEAGSPCLWDEDDQRNGVYHPVRLTDVNPSRRLKEIERLQRFLTRIASPDELVGLGVLEPILADPTGLAERELKARMAMAQRGLDGDEYP